MDRTEPRTTPENPGADRYTRLLAGPGWLQFAMHGTPSGPIVKSDPLPTTNLSSIPGFPRGSLKPRPGTGLGAGGCREA